MATPELAQLELLAQIDNLLSELANWVARPSRWASIRQQQRFLQRLLDRLEPLRSRLETPLVVATFGGTGSGKSSLVNALLGEVLSPAGRQRPTTTHPVLVAHSETALEAYGLPLDELQVIRRDLPLLRDIVLIDCPDPDTSEAETPESNLERLHKLLPWCDVLLSVSTQQKYRSAVVTQELAQAAAGCRIVFVQTHADRDDDIREDWRKQLSADYDIADMFYLDARQALADQQAGRPPSGEFGRLLDLLIQELSATQRIRIRRANLLGLLQAALERAHHSLETQQPRIQQFAASLHQVQIKFIQGMAEQLQKELLESRAAWERRLLGRVVEIWGASPFALVLRTYYFQASWLASIGLMRARSSAQVAIWGAVQGTRWWLSHRDDQSADEQLRRLSSLAPSESALREADIIVQGYSRDAGYEGIVTPSRQLAVAASRLEADFLDDVGRRIDELIQQTARQHTWWGPRAFYEIGFAILPLFLLYRMGRNFFYDSFWRIPPEPLLTTDFYLAAAIFLFAWCVLWVLLYLRRLRRGLFRRVQQLASELAGARLGDTLYPEFEQDCQQFERDVTSLQSASATAKLLRDQSNATGRLSSLRAL